MARYKETDVDQKKMIPVAFDRQILPGSFEYSLSYLIDHELDLSAFDAHYHNDVTGRPAYDPRQLLKIVILAYSKGITSSRQIESLCRKNILFIALSTDQHPDHSTVADFISRSLWTNQRSLSFLLNLFCWLESVVQHLFYIVKLNGLGVDARKNKRFCEILCPN